MGREGRTGEAPKENVWSRIARGKSLQARNLTLTFIFLPCDRESHDPMQLGELLTCPHVFTLTHTYTHTHTPQCIHTPASPPGHPCVINTPPQCGFSRTLTEAELLTHTCSLTLVVLARAHTHVRAHARPNADLKRPVRKHTDARLLIQGHTLYILPVSTARIQCFTPRKVRIILINRL